MKNARDKILDYSNLIFSDLGYHGLSLGNLLKECELSKGAFYHHFKSKEELAIYVIKERIDPWLKKFWIEPLKISKDPIKGIKEACNNYCDQEEKSLLNGNPLTVLLSTSLPNPIKQATKQIYEDWFSILEEKLQVGVKRRYIRPDVNVKETSRHFILIIEGTLSLGRNLKDLDIVKNGMQDAISYIESLNYKDYRRR